MKDKEPAATLSSLAADALGWRRSSALLARGRRELREAQQTGELEDERAGERLPIWWMQAPRDALRVKRKEKPSAERAAREPWSWLRSLGEGDGMRASASAGRMRKGGVQGRGPGGQVGTG